MKFFTGCTFTHGLITDGVRKIFAVFMATACIERFGKQLSRKFCDLNESGIVQKIDIFTDQQ